MVIMELDRISKTVRWTIKFSNEGMLTAFTSNLPLGQHAMRDDMAVLCEAILLLSSNPQYE